MAREGSTIQSKYINYTFNSFNFLIFFPPHQFCDIENSVKSSQNLAKLVEFTTEKTQIPNFLGMKKKKIARKTTGGIFLR